MKTIEKELIGTLQFDNNDVLLSEKERKLRRFYAMRASILGNIEKTKVEIKFRAKQGFYKVKTTVWAVGKDYLMLKSSTVLPLKSIQSISL